MSFLKNSNADHIIEQINIENSKKIALILVIGFIAYHGMLHFRYGIDSCKWLLSDGRYKGGNKEWQPFGCMLHHYSRTDTKLCLQSSAFLGQENYFVFIGDELVQQLYKSFVNLLGMKKDEVKNPSMFDQTTKNLTFYDSKLNVKVEYLYYSAVNDQFVKNFNRWQMKSSIPSIIVASSGLSIIKESNGSTTALKVYEANLTRLLIPSEQLKSIKKVYILWAMQPSINEDKISDDYNGDLEMITNDQIYKYNQIASNVFYNSAVDIWWSLRLIANDLLTESPDGIQLSVKARQNSIQILLNMYCNDNMNFNDGTCCSTKESSTWLQIVTLSMMFVFVLLAIAMATYRLIIFLQGRAYSLLAPPNGQNGNQYIDYFLLVTSLAKLAMIMFYFFLCDRTNFFMKENKYYSGLSFWIPVAYACALGLFFNDDSRNTNVLHEDQMNESRGWMQIFILIYSMIGAYKILPIYMVIQTIISSYLFLAGFEHFSYTWQTRDFSLIRFIHVLFKLNFMTVLLCFLMNRPYQFYYFVPLLSFWYTMLYLLIALPPQISQQSADSNPLHYLYLVLKLVVFFSVVTILYMSEVFFEKVFVTRPWKALFVNVDDNIKEWWNRWKTDRYSVIYGVIFAIFYNICKKYSLVNDTNHSNLFPKRIALLSTFLGIVGLSVYIIFIFLCHNKYECSEIHSYINFLPILCYIVLHNISGILRVKYSTLFAWFGRIYLELFLSQYHIWLAADNNGVLVLLPNHPTLNVVLTTFIFICAAHEIHRLTNVLMPYLVPNNWKVIFRNFFIFLTILVPIGINAGMFT